MYRALAERLFSDADLQRQIRSAAFAFELDRLATTALEGDDRRRGREYLKLILSRYSELLAVPSSVLSHLSFTGTELGKPVTPVFTPCYESDCDYCAAPHDGPEELRSESES